MDGDAQALREMLAQELPEGAPELPIVERLGDLIGSGGAEEAQARARHAAQIVAREEAKDICEQVGLRDVLILQLRDLYKPNAKIHGRNPEGPQELRALAAEILTDHQVSLLMKKVSE